MDDLELIKDELSTKTPAKRLKFLRQKVIKKNQQQFCQDGLIRAGTLKSVETEKLKISPRIAERLTHKMRLEGILCTKEMFLDQSSSCDIQIDPNRKRIIGGSADCLEEIRKKLSILTPIQISKDLSPSLIPNGATALARELREKDLIYLNNTLCLVYGTKIFVSYLSYENNSIRAKCDDKTEVFPTNIINFCELYAIEILYFN